MEALRLITCNTWAVSSIFHSVRGASQQEQPSGNLGGYWWEMYSTPEKAQWKFSVAVTPASLDSTRVFLFPFLIPSVPSEVTFTVKANVCWQLGSFSYGSCYESSVYVNLFQHALCKSVCILVLNLVIQSNCCRSGRDFLTNVIHLPQTGHV